MEKPLTPPFTPGICEFCKAEVVKNKMTQHLKFCKQRLATIATQEKKSRKPKTRLFHILAEGQYNPEYWLHFEIPVNEPLWLLDSFLKDMWIDDLDHLSGFTINGTTYSDEYPEELFLAEAAEEEEEEEEEEISAEEQEKRLKEVIDTVLSQFTEEPSLGLGVSLAANPLWLAWITEVKKPRSIDDFIEFLKGERTRLTKEERAFWKNEAQLSLEKQREMHFYLRNQKWATETLLDAVEDRSMEVSIARVLKVGQKFSYIYDYGSSTYVNLRVIAEREGIVQHKKKPVQLLAQNIAPTFSCMRCGKPATNIVVSYFHDDINGNVYCEQCGKEYLEGGEALPITNSPRVGVL